jgi:hypothetical protein
MFALALVLGACAGQEEPAQARIGEIEAAVSAAAGDAAKYVPDQLEDVRDKLGGLQASFDKKDYAAVLSGSAAVLREAQGLAAAAAAAKSTLVKSLKEQWTRLSVTLPGEVAAVQNRIDLLGRKSSRKLAAGIDLDAAKAGLSDAASLWSKTQAAFAADNLNEAVSTAKTLQTKLETLAAALRLDLGAPAAPAS